MASLARPGARRAISASQTPFQPTALAPNNAAYVNSSPRDQPGSALSAASEDTPMPRPSSPSIVRRANTRSASTPQSTLPATLATCDTAMTRPASTRVSAKLSTRKVTR